MSQRDREALENLSGLRELDRLVVQVMQALQVKPTPDRPPTAEANVIYQDQWGEEAVPRKSGPGPDEDSSPPTQELLEGDEWEDGAEVPVTEDWSAMTEAEEEKADEFRRLEAESEPVSQEEGSTSVLGDAELAFIERTTRWLERRPHRDIILDQIWRRLLPVEVAHSEPADAGAEANAGADVDAIEHSTEPAPEPAPEDNGSN